MRRPSAVCAGPGRPFRQLGVEALLPKCHKTDGHRRSLVASLAAAIRRASSLLSNLCFYLFRHFAPGPSHFLHYFPMPFHFSFRSQTVTLSSKFAILISCSHLEIPRLPHQLPQLGEVCRDAPFGEELLRERPPAGRPFDVLTALNLFDCLN